MHRVKARGREYHYAWRGGPRVWSTDSPYKKHSAEYFAALAAAGKTGRAPAATFADLARDYLTSHDFQRLAPRTQEDYRRHMATVLATFGDVPLPVFEAAGIRHRALAWRDAIKSPRQADQAFGLLARVVAWAQGRGLLEHHRLQNAGRRYSADRSATIWTPEEIAATIRAAPPHVARAFRAALESGLRAGDLIRVAPAEHVHRLPEGRVLTIATGKSRGRRTARVPITRGLADVIDATPADQALLLVNGSGGPWTVRVLSKAVRAAADAAGVRRELHLHDARGFAAWRFLTEFGASLEEIATIMGWDAEYAARMVKAYTPHGAGPAARILRAINTPDG